MSVSAKNVLFEIVFVKLLENETALKLLLRVEDALDQVNPDLFNACDDSLPHPSIILNNSIKHLPVLSGALAVRDSYFLALTPLGPGVLPEITADLFVTRLGHVYGCWAESKGVVAKNLTTI